MGLGRPVDGVGVGAKRLDGRCVGRNHPGEAGADAEEHARVASCPSASGNRPALRLPAACWVVASCLLGARPGSAVIQPSDMRVLGTNHRVRRWCLGQRGASHGYFVRPRATHAATRHGDRLMAGVRMEHPLDTAREWQRLGQSGHWALPVAATAMVWSARRLQRRTRELSLSAPSDRCLRSGADLRPRPPNRSHKKQEFWFII